MVDLLQNLWASHERSRMLNAIRKSCLPLVFMVIAFHWQNEALISFLIFLSFVFADFATTKRTLAFTP
jgi:hypothetical protein